MEYFDLYNRDGERINKIVQRGSKLNDGEYYLVVLVWIRNSKGEYLIQQRNKITDAIPNLWAATGGAVSAGEKAITAALRETYEEIGLELEEKDLSYLNRYYFENEFASYITELYLVEQDVLLNELKLDTLEVRTCQYFTMDEIRTMVDKKQFFGSENRLFYQGYLETIEKS